MEIYKTEIFHRKAPVGNKFKSAHNASSKTDDNFYDNCDGKKNLDNIRVRPGAEFTIP